MGGSTPQSPRRDGASAQPELIAGRYRVVGALGRGGAAIVQRVVDTVTEQELALKRLASDAPEKLTALFELEYYTLAGLEHPSVVRAFDYGNDEHGPFYTMELLSGSDIREHAPLPWPAACNHALAVALALGQLHSRHLIHRDISPRNVWCTEDGQIKLIDFGAVTPFGTTKDIVGTPPFVAPESLYGQRLDQRTDLYALGALLYWMLTGYHAYPAQSLRELSDVWQTPPTSARTRVSHLGRADLPELPAELDALILGLLHHEPSARPQNAADVVDRLRLITGAASQVTPRNLPQPAFVGRKAQLRRLGKKLRGALQGRGSAVMVHGEPGDGKARLLRELAIEARLEGALALQLDAGSAAGEYGLLVALVRLLSRIGVAEVEGSRDPDVGLRDLGDQESRARLFNDVIERLLQLSRQKPLLLCIDDVEKADDGSLWFLVALARAIEQAPVMLAMSRLTARSLGTPLGALERVAPSLSLKALPAADIAEMITSMFGEVSNARRLAERLAREGVHRPGPILTVLQALLDQQAITYGDGTWVIHQEIDERVAAWSRQRRDTEQSAGLSLAAQELVRRMALGRAALSPAECASLLALQSQSAVLGLLEELTRAGVLYGEDRSYRFTDEHARTRWAIALEPRETSEAHARLARSLLARARLSFDERLEAYVHLLAAGMVGEAMAGISDICTRLITTEHARLSENATRLEQALSLCDAQQVEPLAKLPLLAALTAAGYYGDRKLGVRYGERALDAFDSAFHAAWGKRLAFLGRKLSLIACLVISGIRFRRRKKVPGVPALRDAITMFFSAVGALAGMHTICVDADATQRVARRLEPWTVLGPQHPATLLHRFCINLALTVQDQQGRARENWQRMVDELSSDRGRPDFPDALRMRLLYGGLYAMGVLEAWRDDPKVLEIADRLESSHLELYHLSADQLRSVYFAHQGDRARAEHYLAEVEQRAIRLGTAWQTELWAPPAQIAYALRAGDAMLLKRSLAEVERLSESVPSLRLWKARTRGAYLLLRGRYGEAVPQLEASANEERPRAAVGWARSIGALARAYGAMGRHGEAKATAERALSLLSDDDLCFPALNLGLQIAHALAIAGLGDGEAARRALDVLRQRHARGGVLTQVQLHEAYAELAAMLDDEPSLRKALDGLRELYESTKSAAALLAMENARRMLRRSPAVKDPQTTTLDGQLLSSREIEALLERADTHGSTVAARALSLLAQQVSANTGYLWLLDAGRPTLAASLGDAIPDSDLEGWVQEQLPHMTELAQTETDSLETSVREDHSVFTQHQRAYKLHMLSAGTMGEIPVGAVALPLRAGARQHLDPQLSNAVAAHLRRRTLVDSQHSS